MLDSNTSECSLPAKADQPTHRLLLGEWNRRVGWVRQIDEAYDLADRYRAAGVPVVLGGLRWLFGEIYNEREYTRRKRHYMELVKQRL